MIIVLSVRRIATGGLDTEIAFKQALKSFHRQRRNFAGDGEAQAAAITGGQIH